MSASLTRRRAGGAATCGGSSARTAHDDLRIAETEQVREVRMTAGELRDLGLARDVESGNVARRQPLAEPRDESRPIELLAAADLARVVIHVSLGRPSARTPRAGRPAPRHARAVAL